MNNIVHIITGLNNGGAEAVLYRLVTHNFANQHTVISLMGMGKYGPMLREQGIKVVCLNMSRGSLTISGVIKLWCVLRNLKPDVVQTWMYHADLVGGVVARLAGIKSVFWNVRHTNLVLGESSWATILVAKYCARLSSFVPRKIIFCAEKAVQVHSNLGYKKEKVVVIGNGYRLDLFMPSLEAGLRVKDELGLEVAPVLGMVGRFDALKDHENLLDALGALKRKGIDFKCLLVGSDINYENRQITAWIERNNLAENVLLLGQRSDIPAVMNALDLHVLSSRSEAFPNVVAEAMACGTPCVTTDVGDASLIVGDTGWVVPAQDSQLLANAIEAALAERKNKPIEWGYRRFSCRERIKDNFSLDVMVEKYIAAWGFS